MKVVVLLSGGLDSSTCLALAVKKYGAENVRALCLSYGQKHDKEIEAARRVAAHYNVPLIEETVDFFKFSDSTLLKGNADIEHSSYAEQQVAREGGIVATYVPFRNGIFLSIAAAFAYSIGADIIYYGAHKDDAAGEAYPDCSVNFINAMNKAIQYGTGKNVELVAPFCNMNKADIVSVGLKLGVPYELTWSCYEGGDKPCGECGTCIDRIRAFTANGMVDPLMEV